MKFKPSEQVAHPHIQQLRSSASWLGSSLQHIYLNYGLSYKHLMERRNQLLKGPGLTDNDRELLKTLDDILHR